MHTLNPQRRAPAFLRVFSCHSAIHRSLQSIFRGTQLGDRRGRPAADYRGNRGNDKKSRARPARDGGRHACVAFWNHFCCVWRGYRRAARHKLLRYQIRRRPSRRSTGAALPPALPKTPLKQLEWEQTCCYLLLCCQRRIALHVSQATLGPSADSLKGYSRQTKVREDAGNFCRFSRMDI